MKNLKYPDYPDSECPLTLIEKLRDYFPIDENAGVYNFRYLEQLPDGKLVLKTFSGYDNGSTYIMSDDGNDWTDKEVKPVTVHYVEVGIEIKLPAKMEQYYRSVWISIMLRLIVEDLQMETPISIIMEERDDFVTVTGYVYAHKLSHHL